MDVRAMAMHEIDTPEIDRTEVPVADGVSITDVAATRAPVTNVPAASVPATGLRGRLTAGQTLYGTFLGLGCALAAEACAIAGFDWLLADLEHGGGGESTLLAQLLAADAHQVP